ncbi:hypothetical protein [Tepidimonas sp.]|uniref:hypothetical protein n=1 Tax=Tepidimonas sp. TaxID=2002775 RepID=UPI002FE35B09
MSPTPEPATPRPSVDRRLWRWLPLLALAGVGALVFAAYRHPLLLQTVADQLWACF